MAIRLSLAADGAQHWPGVASAALPGLAAALATLPVDQAGIRLHGLAGLASPLAADGVIGRIAATVLGDRCRPVRAICFDKSAATNWALGWHQDRTIAVRERIAVDGFGPWTMKAGMQHVAPPFALLERMVTLRVHLDAVPEGNAPLLIAPGSHRRGRIAETDIADIVAQSDIYACLAAVGDVWAYATPILHASEAAERPARRRVLQIDYSADVLPGGLKWLGI